MNRNWQLGKNYVRIEIAIFYFYFYIYFVWMG